MCSTCCRESAERDTVIDAPALGEHLVCSYNVAQVNLMGVSEVAAADVVRARIDSDLKKEASAILAGMGLSVSDAIRLMWCA
ncbi:type II toxin-antitoxin system RelB/DinJ family antitoxin [Novosphingobium resinovorum]|uniref:type II toxin-antitoxin system RelB/DinJ family antitoxin n=1 Tax=Novosphingobium resinovorum TaxID=158500 RepID=UPI003D29184D